MFQSEAEVLSSIFSPILVRIEHIGSTSIPEMAAKPIIDILVEVTSLAEVDKFNIQMKVIGYISKGENGIPGRRYFRKGTDDIHTHHIHIHQTGNPRIENHIAFREYLKWNKQRATDYKNMKLILAEQYKEMPDKYQEGKVLLSKIIINEATDWYIKTKIKKILN